MCAPMSRTEPLWAASTSPPVNEYRPLESPRQMGDSEGEQARDDEISLGLSLSPSRGIIPQKTEGVLSQIQLI